MTGRIVFGSELSYRAFHSTVFEYAQGILDYILIDVSSYKHDPRAVVVARPFTQLNRRMEKMLNSVNDHRSRRMFENVDDTFDAKEVGTAHSANKLQPFSYSRP